MQYNVRVVPRSKFNKVKEEPGRLKAYLTAPPVDNKANAALIEILAEYFDVKKNRIRVVRGLKSREKVVEIN